MVFLSSQTLQNILKIFLKSLAQQKGIERNLLIKKFIKDILYSKEQIQINLYYLPREIKISNELLHREIAISRGEEDFGAFKKSNIPSGVGWGGDKKEKRIPLSLSENPKFVLSKLAPRAGLEPAAQRLTAACSAIELPRSIS